MTETELRQRAVRQAESWLGRRESDGSHREILAVYNAIRPLPRGYRMGDSDPWCAAFVSAVGAACGLTEILYPECGCEPMIALYRAAGRWQEDESCVPQPGDVVFYDWQDGGQGDNAGGADHVGLVASVSGGSIRVIEGNCSDAVMAMTRPVNGRYIRGYGLPDYAGLARRCEEAAPAAQAAPGEAIPIPVSPSGEGDGQSAPTGASPALPELRRGDRGEAVEAAQLLLIARGYRCGPWGADGDFGAATYGAVYRFQQARGLRVDGIVGPETWLTLIGAAA